MHGPGLGIGYGPQWATLVGHRNGCARRRSPRWITAVNGGRRASVDL